MSYKILAINPGSTSTKAAIYIDEQPLFELTLRHSAEELGRFNHVIEQLDWRRELILGELKEKGFDIAELSAVVGRGGLVKPIAGGVYEVNDALYKDSAEATHEHASNLGALIARTIAERVGVKAYIADPVVVDELEPVARISGLKEIPRTSAFHALNSKAIARIYAKECGKKYDEVNVIVVHMGGGISVSVHSNGRVIDTTNALSGGGCFSPERAGRVEPLALTELCASGKYTSSEIQHMIVGQGGLMSHLGTNSMLDVVNAALDGDAKAGLIFDAFCYNVAKDVGAMSTVTCGKVEAIILTGGIAYNETVTGKISERCNFIAPVKVYPGENELETLVSNTLHVLQGEVETKVYV
ncbi:MAG: butyrate kinase [Rikenellaceae bacterium]